MVSDSPTPRKRPLAVPALWPQTGFQKAHLRAALHQGAEWSRTQGLGKDSRLASVDIDKIVGEFLAHYTGKVRGEYRRQLGHWMDWCAQSTIPPLSATALHIEAWTSKYQTQGLVRSTIRGYLAPILSFYQWAYAQGYIEHDITVDVRRQKSSRRSVLDWLNRSELIGLLDAAAKHDTTTYAALCLFSLNGTRTRETLAANIQHIERTGERTVLRLPYRKGNVMDRLALPDRTVAALHEIVGARKSGPIFRVGGERMSSYQLYRRIDKAAAASGLDRKVRPHMLRATFITLSIEAGVSIANVMSSSGHATYNMVSYYDRAYRAIERNASIPLSEWLDEFSTPSE